MIDLDERRIEKKSFFNRLLFIYLIFALLFLFFLVRIYSLQISSYSSYELASLQNKTRDLLVQPIRGQIYDRNGNVLVKNVSSYNLIIKASEIQNIEKFIINIKEILPLNDQEIEYINKNFAKKALFNRELTIKKNLSKEDIAKFEVRKFNFPNAFIDVRYSRFNMYPYLFAHSLGYVGVTNDEEVNSILDAQNLTQVETIFKYSNGFLKGKTGIESTYDNTLRGDFGKITYEVDATGRFLDEVSFLPPNNGKNIYLALDLEAQQEAFNQIDGRRGAIVAVEINTGKIVTYLSSPTFSINKITSGISTKEFNDLLNDLSKPFFDRAGQGRYSPASTIKPAIGLYGIDNKIIDWNYTIDDPGYFILPEDQRVYRGWKEGGHGIINLNDAIVESSNTFFFSLAYNSDINSLIEHLSNFGFGKNVCADCFYPDNALLPSPQWKINNINSSWFKGDTVNLGVGQGYLSATPLQLSYYAAFLANKGKLKKLSFLSDLDQQETHSLVPKNITNSDWNNLHQSMIDVIEHPKGTAKRLKKNKEFIVAAKSGTVELVSLDSKEDYEIVRENKGKRDHAIIVAFGPMPDPKYAVSVVIENGESGGSVAGPVAIEVLKKLIKE
ncbi:MAG: penicillin-binding protein 2 [SAR86 cluster bacterium]|nr:MAG: penicillin-binding protein 2 [SAR86 cluster bacterium]